MCMPQMVCYIKVLGYQGNSCFSHGPMVRKLPQGAKTNHVVAVILILDVDFVAKPSSLMPRLK